MTAPTQRGGKIDWMGWIYLFTTYFAFLISPGILRSLVKAAMLVLKARNKSNTHYVAHAYLVHLDASHRSMRYRG
jgi:hypothetical protein